RWLRERLRGCSTTTRGSELRGMPTPGMNWHRRRRGRRAFRFRWRESKERMQAVGYVLMLLTVVAFSSRMVYRNVSSLNAVKRAKSWPAVEATVKSGSVEVV